MARPRLPVAVVVGAIATRLVLIGTVFGLAVLLELRGDAPYSERVLTGLYALVLSGLLASLGYGIIAHAGRSAALPWVELLGDGLLSTGLVYCTGGATSIFGFLLVGWIVYATLRLGRVGAMASGAAATVAFGLLTLATVQGALLESGGSISTGEGIEVFARHAAAFLLVGVLADRLGREIARSRTKLRELSELHRRIVDHMPSGLLTVDRAGLMSSFNREAERITGYAAREVIGAPLSWLFPGLGRILERTDGDVELRPEPTIDDPKSLSRQAFTFQHRQGGVRHLGFSCAALRNDAGLSEGTVVIFQDLTRIVDMEDQLVRSERLAAIGRLAAGLAHEIRNPLASLSGSIELLEAELPDPTKDARRLFRIVQRETERLNRLLTEFLHFARPEPRELQAVVMEDFLRDLAELLKAQCKPVSIRTELSGNLVALGDPDRLRQVFWNLMLNAMEADPADGEVRVRGNTIDGGERVEIIVEDRGRGIPREIMDQVFDPFFTTKTHGTGLGLATVHRIVEAHGGRIHVQSEVGVGTTVRVLLAAAGT